MGLLGLSGQIRSHKLCYPLLFVILNPPPPLLTHTPAAPPPPPQIGNSMHCEWYKLRPCLGVFQAIENPCSQQTWLIFWCLFCHIRFRKWRRLIWILTRPPTSCFVYSRSSSGHGNQGPRFSNFDSLGPHSTYCSFPSLLKNERSQFG
jgi:hypothetical protein